MSAFDDLRRMSLPYVDVSTIDSLATLTEASTPVSPLKELMMSTMSDERPRSERELLHAQIAAEFEGDRAAGSVVERARTVRGVDIDERRRLGRGDLHIDLDRYGGSAALAQSGRVHLQPLDVGDVLVVHRVVEVAVEQLVAVEGRAVGKPVDRLENGFGLLLTDGRITVPIRAPDSGSEDHRLQLEQQRVDLLQSGIGGIEHLLRTPRIRHRSLDAHQGGSMRLAGDESAGIVRGPVDPESRTRRVNA